MIMNTFLAHILPSSNLYDGDKTIPLSNEEFRNLITLSMDLFVQKTNPPILIEHEQKGKVFGKVLGVFEDEEGIYCSFQVTDDIAKGIDNGEYRFVSPTIAWNFKADDYNEEEDNTYPAALLEVSLVSVPRHYTRQQDLQELNQSMLGIYNAWDGSYFALRGAEEAALLANVDGHLKRLIG
jgi:hypothetical protein